MNEMATWMMVEAEVLVEAEVSPLSAMDMDGMMPWVMVEAEVLVEAEAEAIQIAFAAETTHVKFSTVEIQEYPIIPGVNPAVKTGVPLTIDWLPLNKNAYDFEEYEQAVEGVRRNGGEMRMPPSRRLHVLRQLGVSKEEIKECMKATIVAKKQRQRTNELLGLAPAHFAL